MRATSRGEMWPSLYVTWKPPRASMVRWADAAARQHPKHRHHRPRRPRQDDARRRHAVAVGALPREPGRRRANDGLDGPGAREGHHHHGQEHGHQLQGRPHQHRGHPRPRRLRLRGRAHAHPGRRGAAAGRRRRGPPAPDALRAQEGAGSRAATHRGHQQDRPLRRPPGRGAGRGLRPVHRPRGRRGPARVPGAVHQRPHGHGHHRPQGRGPDTGAPLRDHRGHGAPAALRSRPSACSSG